MCPKSFGSKRLAGVLAALPMLVACAHDKPPAAAAAASSPPACTTPEPVAISVTASTRLNPGDKGEALATVVRLYQVKTREKITAASFDEMLDRDKETLGDDLLAMQELTIAPGDSVKPQLVRNADAGYIAAVALFRQPAAGGWRALRKLPPVNPQFCNAARGKDSARDEARFFLDESRVELR
jgi:type VI secretion system VasD/TssJ family lipoprotein